MYRHATYINCTGCGRSLSLQESELDEQARDICTRCHTLHRVDFALARWRDDARHERWLHLGAGAVALGLVATVPALLLVGALTGLVVWIVTARQD